MDIFETMKKTKTKEVLFFDEPNVGLKAILAINNTTLGPALCSCKLYPYDTNDDAVEDALKIAKYNTYRSALSRRDIGGGSIVLIGDPEKVKSEKYFRALGVFIDKLKGKVFVVSESGVSDEDLLELQRETEFVLGLPEIYGGSGDRAARTAKGVLWGMKAAAKEKLGDISLKGLKVSVRGVGYVGKQLVKELLKEGAVVTVTDKVYDKIKEVQDEHPEVKVVKPSELHKQKCDIFAPCAFDNSITMSEAEYLNCSIIAGSTNCAISNKKVLKYLEEKGILVLPGYLINSGDVIQVSNELDGYNIHKTESELKSIYYRTLWILQKAKKEKKFVSEIAIEEAEKYIDEISYIKSLR